MASCVVHGEWEAKFLACPKCFKDGDVRAPLSASVPPVATHDELERLWMDVRLCAEGSDWKRDQGEALSEWAYRTLKKRAAARSSTALTALEIAELKTAIGWNYAPNELRNRVRALLQAAAPSATGDMERAAKICDDVAEANFARFPEYASGAAKCAEDIRSTVDSSGANHG